MAPTTFYYLVPPTLILIIIEIRHSLKEQKHLYEKKDTLLNFLAGAGFFFTNFISKLFVFGIYEIIYQYRIFTSGDSWWVWIIALLAHDFSFYWWHRTAHTVNWFWASHAVHHSSKHFNLSVAFRMPWTDNLTGQFIFWLWIPLLGIHPVIIM